MKKTKIVRVDKSFDNYLERISRQTGLSKIDVSRMLAQNQKNNVLLLRKKKKGIDASFMGMTR